MTWKRVAILIGVLLATAGCHRPPTPAASLSSYAAIVSAPDRTPDDRALDAGRKPAELLARAVGPTGTVYAQNNRLILDRFAEKPWNARLTRSAMGNVVRVDREFDDPLPPDARNLDAVVIILLYHDLFWMGADRGRMNREVFDHLRPGGLYIIVDHSARPGSGSSGVQTLHRIEEPVVRDEVERAGFTLVRTADFLRNPADTRDWNDSPRAAGERRGTSDRFVLAFVKP